MKENFSIIVDSYNYKELYESIRKRPGIYFGSVSLWGLHNAIISLVHHCIDNNKRAISLTVNGADIAIRHEGERLACDFEINVVKAACESFIYEDNQFQLNLDKDIFETVEPNIDVLFDALRELAFLNSDLRITFNERAFHYKNGLIDLYNYLQARSGAYWVNKCIPISFCAQDEGMEVDVVFARVSSPFDLRIFSYVNNHRTDDNGVHVDGFIEGLNSELNKYKQHSCGHMTVLKDMNVGLIIHVKTQNPTYSGATKRKLASPEVHQFIVRATRDNLKRIFAENSQMASSLMKCWRCA